MAQKRKKGIPGAGSVYQRQSDGRWVASFIEEETGKRRYLYADKDDNTQQNAYKKLQEALFLQKQGRLASGPRQTVEQFLTRWFEDVYRFEVRETTYPSRVSVLHARILPALGHIPLQKLTAQQVQNFYADLAKRGLAPASIRGTHVILHKALEQAVRWNLVSRNVCDAVALPKKKKYHPQMLTKDQIVTLLKGSQGHPLEAFIWLGLALGLRHGELLGLHWKDINWEERTLRIGRTLTRLKGRFLEGDPKSETSGRTIVLPRFLLASLQRHQARQEAQRAKVGDTWQDFDLVFCGPAGGYRHQTKVRESFRRLLRRIGLPRMRVHDLRHNASTFLQMVLRMPAKMVQDILGHADIGMTFDYTHSDLTTQREMMDDWDRFFDDLFGKE